MEKSIKFLAKIELYNQIQKLVGKKQPQCNGLHCENKKNATTSLVASEFVQPFGCSQFKDWGRTLRSNHNNLVIN